MKTINRKAFVEALMKQTNNTKYSNFKNEYVIGKSTIDPFKFDYYVKFTNATKKHLYTITIEKYIGEVSENTFDYLCEYITSLKLGRDIYLITDERGAIL